MFTRLSGFISQRATIIAAALVVASGSLLFTPDKALAESTYRSCMCNNPDLCANHFARFCCDFEEGSPPSCACQFWIVNCVEPE